MKKFLAFLTIVIFLLCTSPVSAHFLATDKNIGAVLHIDPGDEPLVGQQTSFFFEFKDKDNRFDPKNCDCTFVISNNGNNIYSQPLFQNSSSPTLTNAAVFYTFNQKGAYKIIVNGKPTSPNVFKEFNLKWNLRVDDRGDGNDSAGQNKSFFSTHFLHLIIIGIGAMTFLYLLYNDSKKQKKSR
jgi:hypothetical protein